MGIYNGFPPVTDPEWIGKTRKLLEFLERPRDWQQLESWSRRGALLRQSLAWLEDSGEACTFHAKGTLYWVTTDYLIPEEPTDDASSPVFEGEGDVDDDSLVSGIPSPDD